MANLLSQLIVSLVDRVSAPAKTVSSALKGIGQAAANANAKGLADIANANSAAMAKMRAGLLGVVAAAYSLKEALGAPVSVAADFQTILLDIAQKSDLSDTAMAQLGERIRALAPIVNKTAQEVAAGIDVLTSMGLDPVRALAISPILGKAATAYRAEMSDVAKMTFAAIDNLKVPVSETARLLDILAKASKEGAFEFKDMAREFPTIAAIGQAIGEIGVTGATRLAAALETVRKGFGDSASAATGLRDVLIKSTSDEVTKRFKGLGIDSKKVLADARKSGADIMETLATMTMKAINGDMSRIGDIWTDKEARIAMTSFIQNWAEYRRIKKAATESTGTVDVDFERRMKTFAAQANRFKIAINDLGISIGSILIPHINELMTTLKPIVDRMRAFSDAHPVLVGNIVKSTAALIALSSAIYVARFAFFAMRGAALTILVPLAAAAAAMSRLAMSMLIMPAISAVVSGFAALRRGLISLVILGAVGGPAAVFKALGVALLGLLNPIGLVSAALRTLKLAVVSTGIGALLVGIAAAGIFIYENWKGLGEFFKSFGSAFMAALGPAGDAIRPLIDGVSALWEKLSGFLGEISPATWSQWGTAAGTAVGNLVTGILELPGKISALASQLYQVGVSAMTGLWDGMKSLVEDLIAWVATIPGRVVDALASVPGALREAITGNPGAANDNTEGKPGSAQRRKAALRIIGNPEDNSAAPVVDEINGTIGPQADTSGIQTTRQAVAALKKEIAEVNGMSIRVGTSGGGLMPGGSVRRRADAEHSDYGTGP